MSIVYGYEPIAQNDPMLSILVNYSEAALRGVALQNVSLFMVFPFCECLLLNC